MEYMAKNMLICVPKNLKEGFDLLNQKKYSTVFPVCAFSYPVLRGLQFNVSRKVEMKWPENLNVRSQDLEKIYHDAGQFYWFGVEDFMKQKKLFTENSGAIILNELQVQDIDTENDWLLAEMKYKLFRGKE